MAAFRSEDMTLCQMFLQSEAAYACVSELGELGLVQFRDLNPDVNAFQRKFVNEVRRCDEMERKLRFLEKEIRRDGIPMLDTGDNPDAPAPREMIDLEAAFEKLENELKEVNNNSEALKRNYLELTELRHILKKTRTFFEEAELHHTQALHDPSLAEETLGLLGEEAVRTGGHALRLGFVAGVILRERIPAFERLLWRACRGNVFLRQAEIESPLEDPVTGDQVNKSVFIIFFQGDQLKSRVKKICEGFRATLYPCPETQTDRREMEMGVATRIEDLNTVLGQTQEHRHRVLVSAARQIKVWFIKVHKIKAIYHTLNMFNLDVTQKCLIAECWCPVADLDRIQQALRRGTEQSGSSVPSILNRMTTKEAPPTYNRTNKFTQAFQNIVDAYGVASYREVNPALFTITTFPFLFAVMYGDAGHGIIMFIFALWMVLYEKPLSVGHRSDAGIWDTFFSGRYVILCMGLFSIYTGLIYNDIFSRSINLFQTAFHSHYSPSQLASSELLQMDPVTTFDNSAYPFGIDPIWQISKNKIVYVNSFKMKLSIILGVFQMYFGIMLSLWNLRFFKQKLDIFFCFIPEMVFLFCLVGYLVVLVFVKWIGYDASTSKDAPNLLLGLINMFMFKTTDKSIYSGQSVIQAILVILAVVSVFVLMFGKPLMLRRQAKSRPKTSTLHHAAPPANGPHATDDQEVVHHDASGTYKTHEEPEEEPFDFGDIMMHQMIHTIEFCLGCISHSASYLRLWALSLAHSQLSEVLWTMIMHIPLSQEGYLGCVFMVPIFAAWAMLTIGILLIMEGLSAFLHALRLHWIEFQSKFYKGEGYLFLPFSFEVILEQYDQLEEAGAS